jgi:cytochrome c oxidase assembly protein subunit 15
MTVQATLGILTLLHQVPILLALTHQGVAIVVLTLAVVQSERLASSRLRTDSHGLTLAQAS